MDTKVDGGKETVIHQNEIAPVGVGDDHLFLRIEECDVAFDDKTEPTVIQEKLLDLLMSRWSACDGWLPNQKAEPMICVQGPKKVNIVTEDFIMQMPTLEIRDG